MKVPTHFGAAYAITITKCNRNLLNPQGNFYIIRFSIRKYLPEIQPTLLNLNNYHDTKLCTKIDSFYHEQVVFKYEFSVQPYGGILKYLPARSSYRPQPRLQVGPQVQVTPPQSDILLHNSLALDKSLKIRFRAHFWLE